MGGMDGPESSANRKLPRKAIKFHYSVIRQVSATFPRVHDSVSSSPSGKQMAWLDQLLPVFDSGLVRGRGVGCGWRKGVGGMTWLSDRYGGFDLSQRVDVTVDIPLWSELVLF